MSEENTPTQGLSVDAAVDALMGTPSTSEETNSSPEELEVTAEAETVEAASEEEATEAIAEEVEETEEAPEASSVEEEQPEEDSDSAEPVETDVESPTAVLFHMEDGTPVTVEDAKRGYLRQADYTRKTQETAEIRKELQGQFEQAAQDRQTLAENLAMALDVIEPQLAELARTDWDSLRQTDAYAYREKRDEFELKTERYNAMVAQGRQMTEQNKQRLIEQRQQLAIEEGQKLRMAMPDFGDPVKGPELKAKMHAYTREIGLSPDEVKNIVDHRLVMVMEKARRYDELMKADKTVADKKLSKTPKKSLKAGTPKSADQRAQQARQDKFNRLKHTGKVDDAVAFLMNS